MEGDRCNGFPLHRVSGAWPSPQEQLFNVPKLVSEEASALNSSAFPVQHRAKLVEECACAYHSLAPVHVLMMLQIMLGVDRLDMIKGIPQKLLAFEKFLEEHPEWRDKVLLVQIAVPTRGDVPEYQVPSTPDR